jgi:hypothetical protein
MPTNDVPYVRPGFFMTRIVNPVVRRTGATTLLTVRGRISGEPHMTPLGKPFEFPGCAPIRSRAPRGCLSVGSPTGLIGRRSCHASWHDPFADGIDRASIVPRKLARPG